MAELEIKPTVASRTRVSAVILAAGCITGALIFLLSGGGADSFASKATLATFMPDVTGLAQNSEVRLNGIRIGHVTKVDVSRSLDPQRAVRVDMKVTSRFLKSIPRDSQTSVGADTLVGFKFIAIAMGKSPLPVPDTGILQSEPLKQADDRADLIRTFQAELNQVDKMLIQVSAGDSKIGRYVTGDKEYKGLLQQVSVFDQTLRAFMGPGSVAGQALFTNDMYRQFRAPLLNVDKALAAIQGGEGVGGRLFASDDQYNLIVRNLKTLRASLADANAGKGRFGAVLHDDTAHNNVLAMLKSTDAMLLSLQSGEGRISQLVRDPQLYESLNGSLRHLQSLVEDLRTNPQKYLRYKVF